MYLFLATGNLLAAAACRHYVAPLVYFSRACRPVPMGALSHAKRFRRTDKLSSSCARVVAVGPGSLSDKLSGL